MSRRQNTSSKTALSSRAQSLLTRLEEECSTPEAAKNKGCGGLKFHGTGPTGTG